MATAFAVAAVAAAPDAAIAAAAAAARPDAYTGNKRCSAGHETPLER